MGMVMSMMPNTTMHRMGMTPANTIAAWVSMVKAMTIAPNTTKGDRSSSRRVRFTPFWT